MKDEYGEMDNSGETHIIPKLVLESGKVLKDCQVRYKTYGALNTARNNVVVVSHALTGNADLASWWGDLLGPGKAFDTSKYLVVCANVLGSPYGSSSALTVNPETGRLWGGDFPYVTIRDSVKAHSLMVRDGIKAKEVACAIGGSMGGMQALEWLFEDVSVVPVRHAICIAAGGKHHAWQIGISECQRQAIYADPNWKGGHYTTESHPDKVSTRIPTVNSTPFPCT